MEYQDDDSNQRVFKFPSTNPLQEVWINVLCIGTITLNENSPGLFNVSIHTNSDTWSTNNFPTESQARAFVKLWIERIENAR